MDKRTEDDHIHVISVMSLVCGFRNHGFSNIQDKNKLTNNNYRGKKVAMRSAYEQRLRLQQNKMKIQSNLNIKANQREPENVFFLAVVL